VVLIFSSWPDLFWVCWRARDWCPADQSILSMHHKPDHAIKTGRSPL
jgi:hypothetical protein